MLTALETAIEGERCISAKGYPPLSYRFWCEQVRASQSTHTQPLPKIRVYHNCTCNASRQRGTAHIVSREWMEESLTGSAKQLGLSKAHWPGSTKYRVKVPTGTS